jgi:uncharacterized protein YdiU (UPF0061 family)
MREKLGLFNEEELDESLIEKLLTLMQEHKADFTNTFDALTTGNREDSALFQSEGFGEWQGQWQKRRKRQEQSEEDSSRLMRSSNPAVIPRNHRVEEALEAAVEREDYSVMERLLTVLSNPYEQSPEKAEYCKLPAHSSLPYRTYCGT